MIKTPRRMSVESVNVQNVSVKKMRNLKEKDEAMKSKKYSLREVGMTKPRVIRAWVCIDEREAVGYIHYGNVKPITDTNYQVYRAEIRPIKPTKKSTVRRGKK